MRQSLPPALFLLSFFVSGCVTKITTDVTQNPPPLEAFSAFNRIELRPVVLQPPYAGQEANERALKKIQENVDEKMTPVLPGWNQAGSSRPGSRSLRIEPTVTEIKFISGAARFGAGAFAGSSAVILKARIVEVETGKVIAEPMFFARAAAMAGAWTFGSTDNLMLVRIANRLTNYLLGNYDQAVGGPTGAEPKQEK